MLNLKVLIKTSLVHSLVFLTDFRSGFMMLSLSRRADLKFMLPPMAFLVLSRKPNEVLRCVTAGPGQSHRLMFRLSRLLR